MEKKYLRVTKDGDLDRFFDRYTASHGWPVHLDRLKQASENRFNYFAYGIVDESHAKFRKKRYEEKGGIASDFYLIIDDSYLSGSKL